METMQARLMQVGVVAAALVAFGVTGIASGQGVDPADLSLTKTDDPDPVAEGGLLTYTIEIRNAGPDPATSVTVTDKLPAGIEFVGATPSTGTCERQGNRVICELGDLIAGDRERVTIQVRPRKEGELSNTATVESPVADPNAQNNSDTELTRVQGPPVGPTCARKPATILGTPGDDTLFGDGSGNVIRAFGGDDLVRARAGNDTVCLNAGKDKGRGGAGHDLIKGGAGKDRIVGGPKGDSLRGGKGRDRLRGGPGNDVLRGGPGRDICRGGPGKDIKRSC